MQKRFTDHELVERLAPRIFQVWQDSQPGKDAAFWEFNQHIVNNPENGIIQNHGDSVQSYSCGRTIGYLIDLNNPLGWKTYECMHKAAERGELPGKGHFHGKIERLDDADILIEEKGLSAFIITSFG